MNNAGRSRNARLNQALDHATALVVSIQVLRGLPSSQVADNKDAWQDGRNALEQLTQCFHEANAYNNTLLSQKEPEKS